MLSHIKKKRSHSTTSMATNKGLLNEPGENNCFLNSAIQVLWHLDVFRRSFRQLSGHACMGASCIFCALKDIFQQFQYSKDHALPPTVLRSALAETFQSQNRFQLRRMDDAAECFENILSRIHFHIANKVNEDACTAPHCITHQKFGLTMVQQCVCECGATSEPLPFIEMIHYVSATALCAENDAMSRRYGTSVTSQMFGRLIRVAGSWGELRNCPSDCGAQIETRKVLMNCPDVVSIGIVWDSDEPQIENIVDLVDALGTTLRLADLFHTVVDERAARMELYLVGMVCYYGKHYSTFFFHTKLRKWVYFDDAQVSEVGKRWSTVISKCIKGRYQPLLLLYANPHATPVSASTAPKDITLLPGYPTVINEPIPEMAENDSLNSEGDEESSGTESTIQNPVTKSSRNQHSPRRSKPTEAAAPSKSSSSSGHKHPSKNHSKEHKKQSKFYVEKSTRAPVAADSAINQAQSTSRPPKIPQQVPVEKADSRPRKPIFQWNMTDEQSKASNVKVGHYVEPQPANWTTYRPYNQPVTKKVIPNNPMVSQNPRKTKSTKEEDSVTVTDSRISPTASLRDLNQPRGDVSRKSSRTSQRSDVVLPLRTPSPSVSSKSQLNLPPQVVIGRSSSSNKSRRSSQSSVSSSSSAGGGNPLESPVLNPSANATVVPTPKPRAFNERTTTTSTTTSSSSSSLAGPNTNSSEKQENEKCAALFRDADDLMEQSKAADAIMDYGSAFQLCLEATKVVESIITMENLPEEFMVQARLKHSECINKSRILERRRTMCLQSSGSESGRTRSSMVEADRHITASANQILKPTQTAVSTNQQASRENGTATPANNVVALGKRSSFKDRKLINHLEKNESSENLIDFNKHGVTKLQNDVHNMFEHQRRIKQAPHHRQPLSVATKVSNSNNNNSSKATSRLPRDKTKELPNRSNEDAADSRTKIFVWGNPDEEDAADNDSVPQNRSSTGTNSASVARKNASDKNERARNQDQPSCEDAKQSSSDLQEVTRSIPEENPRRFRSITPTLTSGSETNASVSQQRRSKTPTPTSNKNMLRSKLTIGQQRESNVRNRPKSAFGPSSQASHHGNGVENPNASSVQETIPSDDLSSGHPKANPTPYSFPFPFSGWPPSQAPPNYNPAMIPPEYYHQFYKWLQYYSQLPPDQRNMLSFPMAPHQPPFPPMFPPAPKAPPAASNPHLQTQLGKNLTNFTNSVGRATPHIRNTNSNIYESSKPKPIHKNQPRTSTSNNPDSSTSGTSKPRSTNPPIRRPPVELRPNNMLARREANTASAAAPVTSRDYPRPMRAERSAQVNDQSSNSVQQTEKGNDQPRMREGMMKWAEEGKKRTPDTTMTAEYRSKLLQEFANRPRKDRPITKQTVLQQYPDYKDADASSSEFNSVHQTLHDSVEPTEDASTHKCELCGLVKVPIADKYCSSCQAYLARFKPTTNSLRRTKNIT